VGTGSDVPHYIQEVLEETISDKHNRLNLAHALLHELREFTHDVCVEQVPVLLRRFHVILETTKFFLLPLDGFAISLSFQLEFTFLTDEL
jgi:hypothetical protein